MSAFTVGSDHIDLMVTVAMGISRWSPQYVDLAKLGDELGRELWKENYDSVNHRYAEQEQVPEYSWRPVVEYVQDLTDRQLVQVLKAAHCYDYQTCEHPGWKDSKAYWVSQAIQAWAERELYSRGVTQSAERFGEKCWPGEDEALWEWSREEEAARS